MNTTLVISTSALADILCNYFGNENFELGPVVRDSVVVGVCSIFGGFVGGQFGIVIGAAIGKSINTYYFGSDIVTLRQLINSLNETQLGNLRNRVCRVIVDIIGMIGRVVYSNQFLTTLLKRFGNNSAVQSSVIETIKSFFRGIHGNSL